MSIVVAVCLAAVFLFFLMKGFLDGVHEIRGGFTRGQQ